LDEHLDENLVADSRNGDKSAYTLLVKKYYKHVYLVCMGILGNTSDAEDVAQDVMLKSLVEIKKLRDGSKFAQWLTRIAKNKCLNMSRRQKCFKKAIEEKTGRPEQSEDQNYDIRKAIAKLPQDVRLPLVMYYYNGQKVKHVAEKLNMSTASVYLKLRAATNQLHEILSKQEDIK
jgi:RNA polymerase sigma factor (sigma-70 family)